MERELNSILDAIDTDYIKFSHDVVNGTEYCLNSRQMKSVFGQLSVDDELAIAKRIVLPHKAVKEVLRMAHLPHAGITKTYELLRSLYFWPGMYNDVKQFILACGPCAKNAVHCPRILIPQRHPLPTLDLLLPVLGWTYLILGQESSCMRRQMEWLPAFFSTVFDINCRGNQHIKNLV